MARDPASDLRAETLARLGDAAELTAFELPLHPTRFPDIPCEVWQRVNPLRPRRTTKARRREPRPTPPKKPTLPAHWQRYIGERDRPFARLLRRDPLPGESSARATRRTAKVRSYLGAIGSYTATTNRRMREAAKREGIRTAGLEWRVELTGYIERTGSHGDSERLGQGTQVSPWQFLEAGKCVSDRMLKAVYYDTARAAIRTQTDKLAGTVSETRDGRHGPGTTTSTLYDGDSDEAVLFPITLRIRWRHVDR